MKRFFFVGILALGFLSFALAPAAHAGTVALALNATGTDMTFTISGTYAAGVPSVANIAAPNDPYSMSFTLPTNPSSLSSFIFDPLGTGFAANADFSFSLNGASSVTLPSIQVFFYINTGGNVGGLFFCLDAPTCGTYWTIAGPELFTGAVSNPTLGLTGLLPGQTMDAQINPSPIYSGYGVDGVSPFAFVTPTPTPEPASLLLLGTGLFGLGMVLRRRLKLT